jgi:hypothetical protein
MNDENDFDYRAVWSRKGYGHDNNITTGPTRDTPDSLLHNHGNGPMLGVK